MAADLSGLPGGLQLPLVSVIIPCFRGERFIEDALHSVGSQVYRQWEIIVVEDGSHDATESIVGRFAPIVAPNWLRFFQHAENRGVSAARNSALQHARGTYVAFLDADDRWQPEHLALSVDALESARADLCFSGVERFGGDGAGTPLTGLALDLAGDWRTQLFESNSIVLSSVVVRREAVHRAGLFDPAPELQHAEDYDLWLRLAACGAPFTSTGKISACYREHPQQASARKPMMKAVEWNVVQRHAGTYPAPAARKRRRLATLAVGVGMEHWTHDPRAAARYLRQAVRCEPFAWRHWWLAGKAAVRALFKRSPR